MAVIPVCYSVIEGLIGGGDYRMLYSTSQLKVLKSHYTYIWLILSAISFSVRACIAPSISREEDPPEEKWYLRGEKSSSP